MIRPIMGPGLAFAHINLRRNPFGQLGPEALARLACDDAPHVAKGEAVQILAPQGRGKTTWLHAIAAAHPGCVQARVELLSHRPAPVPTTGAAYLLDEADYCATPQLRDIARQASTLVLSTHQDLSARVSRRLRTVCTPPLNVERLCRIVEARIECCRRAPGRLPRLSHARLAGLVAAHGDDLRTILDVLYDVFQDLEGVDDGRLQSVDRA
jgi:hypothetical protein